MTPVDTARWLLAGVMVGMLFSPPAAVLLELALYAVMLGSADCRARLARAVREPLPAMVLAFWLVVGLGLLYSIAPWRESVAIWLGWRRLLLLVFAFALFDETAWKARLACILVAVATAGALASYASALANFSFRYYETGIVFRNHVTQSMVFALAAFAAVLLLKDGVARSPTQRIALATAALLLSSNVVFVTTGRSGYAALLVVSLVAAYTWRGAASHLQRLGVTVFIALIVAGALASSPIVQQRVGRGLDEIRNYERGSEVSAMGERVVFLRNTVELVLERPLFGYGTGAFRTAYAAKVEGRPGREGIRSEDPHNAYLSIVVQHGVLGLLVFLSVLACALRAPASGLYRLLALGALAAWCVTSLFTGMFSIFAEGRLIWLWLGVCLARERGPA